MNLRPWLVTALCLSACASAPHPPSPSPATPASTVELAPPRARRAPHPQTIHGQTLTDDYFWLRNKGTPEVENYLRAENAYTQAMTKASEPLRAQLYKEMLARVQETDASVPHRKDGWYYYERTVAGQEYPVLCRKSAAGAAPTDRTGATARAPEVVMLDLNELAKTEKFVALGAVGVSPDARWLAYAIDNTGFRQYTLRFKNLQSGKLSPESIPRVDSLAWANDNRTVFYVVEDATAKRSYRLYRHVVGANPTDDTLVYEEKDEMFFLDVSRSRSGAMLLANSESKTTNELRILPTSQPLGAWQVIEPRHADHLYYAEDRGAELYIRTNSPARPGGAKAVNFRLVTAPLSSPSDAHWKELVPHRPDVMLEDVEVFAQHVVLYERADALPRLVVMRQKSKPETIALPEPLYSVFPGDNDEYDATTFRFHFESPITPDTVYDYDTRTNQLTALKQDVVKGYDPTRYETRRTTATASDGTRIPISLVYKKGMNADAAHPHPLLLYGYGSYGISMPLTFSSERISLLDRGVVWALAHVRGGGDLGKPWHEGGRMKNKMNTFTDFIACGEELEKSGWTARDRVVIEGASAGGLLMGAVTNLRPELWNGVVAQVPFVDVMNTMLDETLPETVTEFEEWGNPKHADDFDAMIQYSPYDNVIAKNYPAMLVESSYNDSQVMYWEPAKYVAKLRALKTDKQPLMFKVNMEPAGHDGQSGRYNGLKEEAFTDAWILGRMGIDH